MPSDGDNAPETRTNGTCCVPIGCQSWRQKRKTFVDIAYIFDFVMSFSIFFDAKGTRDGHRTIAIRTKQF